MERAKDVEWEGFELFQEPPSQTLTSLANTTPPERIHPLHNLPAHLPKERSTKITHKPNPRPVKLEASTLARLSLPAEIQGVPVRQVEEEREKERGRGRAEARI